MSPALEGKFLTNGPPGKSLTTPLLKLQFLPHCFIFLLIYTYSLISPALKYMKASPDSQSVSQFSCSVVSDSLQPHESQYARPPCPSPTPRVHSDSPDSTFLLISTLFLSFHHRQISWNMSLFPILPSILSSPSLSWQLLRHCSRAVSCSQISWSYLCYLCIWCLSITGQLPVSLDHYLPLALVTCTF